MIAWLYKVAIIVLVAMVVAVAIWYFEPFGGGERRRDLDPWRENLAQAATREIAEKLPEDDLIHVVIIPPIAGDVGHWLAEILADAIAGGTNYRVVDPKDIREVMKERFPGQAVLARDQALEIAREKSAEGVVLGRTLSPFTQGRKGVGAEIDLEVELARSRDGLPVPDGRVRVQERVDSRASLAYFRGWMQSVSWVLRLLVWMVVAVGLPLALYPVITRVLAQESNRTNAIVIGALTAVDLFLAAALRGFVFGFGGFVMLGLALVAALAYNIEVCDRMDEARK